VPQLSAHPLGGQKIMNRKIIVLLLLILLVDSGCKKDNPIKTGDNTSPTIIMPLSVGNQWILKITNADSSNPVTAIDTMSVEKDTTINGELWFHLRFLGVFGDVNLILTNRADGLYEFYHANSPQVSLWLKYPSAPGAQYVHNNPIEVISINDTIIVPAGQFVCYHYSSTFYDYWFSPNIGVIKYEEYVGLYKGTKIGTFELQKYYIN
jgi:hypothetical protein